MNFKVMKFNYCNDYKVTESKIEAAYGEALKISELKLAPTNSTKLILIVNFSMFYKQIMNCIKKSYEIIEHVRITRILFILLIAYKLAEAVTLRFYLLSFINILNFVLPFCYLVQIINLLGF